MLVVWLFAMLTGVVNACVLSTQGQPDAQAHAGHDMATMADMGAMESDDHAAPAQHIDEHAGCNKFCQDQSNAWSGGKTLDHPDFTHVLVETGATPAAWIDVPRAARRVDDGVHASGPPLVIRFLRLTL